MNRSIMPRCPASDGLALASGAAAAPSVGDRPATEGEAALPPGVVPTRREMRTLARPGASSSLLLLLSSCAHWRTASSAADDGAAVAGPPSRLGRLTDWVPASSTGARVRGREVLKGTSSWKAAWREAEAVGVREMGRCGRGWGAEPGGKGWPAAA